MSTVSKLASGEETTVNPEEIVLDALALLRISAKTSRQLTTLWPIEFEAMLACQNYKADLDRIQNEIFDKIENRFTLRIILGLKTSRRSKQLSRYLGRDGTKSDSNGIWTFLEASYYFRINHLYPRIQTCGLLDSTNLACIDTRAWQSLIPFENDLRREERPSTPELAFSFNANASHADI